MSYVNENISTHYEWLSRLNVENRPKNNYRRTSIICTIGMQPPILLFAYSQPGYLPRSLCTIARMYLGLFADSTP